MFGPSLDWPVLCSFIKVTQGPFTPSENENLLLIFVVYLFPLLVPFHFRFRIDWSSKILCGVRRHTCVLGGGDGEVSDTVLKAE